MLKAKLKLIKARRGLLKLKKITEELSRTRHEGLQAREYHANYMYKISALVWFSYFNKNRRIFAKIKRAKTIHTRK